MKKVFTTGVALLLVLLVAPALTAGDDKEKKAEGCAASSGCGAEKASMVVAGDVVTVSGKLVHCKETMGKVAAENNMCPKGTPASGKAVLVQTETGDMILVTAEEKIELPETVTKIRAKGELEGTALKAASIEGYCSKSDKWHELVTVASATL